MKSSLVSTIKTVSLDGKTTLVWVWDRKLPFHQALKKALSKANLLKLTPLILMLLCACVQPPSSPVPTSLMPPKPKVVARRTALAIPIQTNEPLIASWDYDGPPATFNLYSSPDLQQWSLFTNVPDQQVRIPVQDRQKFFGITTVIGTRESKRYWEK